MHPDRFPTRTPCAAVAVLFLFCSFCTFSHAGELAVSSVPERIDITLKYAGGKVILFGEAEEDALIIARLMAVEHETTKLNKKGKRGIFWMNVKIFELSHVPPLYIVHTSGPLEGLPPKLRIQTGSDRDYTAIKRDARLTSEDPERDLLLENYFRLKEKQGLYGTLTDTVLTIKGRLFKSEFFMPSKAPAGLYRFDVFAVKDNAVIASGSTEIRLGRVGIEYWLTAFAQDHGLLYGLMAVVTALVAGIGVGLVFRGAPHAS
jgi:uncharacterized protein (TIGR02186 family)